MHLTGLRSVPLNFNILTPFSQPLSLVFVCHIIQDRALRYWATIGDIKSDRVIVQPVVVPTLVPGKVETFTMQFQAPQGAGLYTFQAVFVNNAIVDSEVRKGMKVRPASPLFFSPVLSSHRTDPSTPFQLTVEEPVEEEASEDEISDPDEDTIEGQLAQLKGGSVKKKVEGGEDDESSDESSSDEDTPKGGKKKVESDSSSDSDSD